MIAVEALPLLEQEAKERQGARTDLTCDKKLTDVDEKKEPIRASEQAAKIFQTNRQHVSDAKKLKTEAPDLAEELMVIVRQCD